MTNTQTQPEFVGDALTKLKDFFSKQQLQQSLALPTDKLYPVLRAAIRELEKYAGMPAKDSFLKVMYNKGEFVGLKVPEIALVKGEISIISQNVVYPAKTLLSQKEGITFQRAGEAKNKNVQYFLVGVSKENEETGNLPFKVWLNPESELDTYKLKAKREYLKENLFEYVFPSDTLSDGKYTVTSWKKNGKFFTLTIDGLQYHAKEKHIAQLNTRNQEGKSTTLVLDGMRSLKLEDGTRVEFRNVYVDGFEPAVYLKNLIGTYLSLPSLEELAEKKSIVFPEPLVLNILGTSEAAIGDKTQVIIKCQTLDGKQHAIVPNAALRRAYDLGKFNVASFDGYQIRIVAVEHYNGYAFKLDWIIPQSSINTDEVTTDLADALGLVA